MKTTATVNDVVFTKQSHKGTWMIILTDQGTFKGEMAAEPKSGQEYEFNGDWTVYNGQKEFKFIGSMPVIPADPYALLCYVCNNAKGVGPKLKEAIWETHGEMWESTWGSKLKGDKIKGLTDDKSKAIQKAIEEAKLNEVQVKILSFLMQHQCSEGLAYKAWNEWKQDAITKVEENCFCLTELIFVGFGHIDGKIRESFGMEFTDTRRIKSGVEYSYKQATSSGATAVPAQDLIKECEKTLRINNEFIIKVLQVMLEAEKFRLFKKDECQYFSSWEHYVYELALYELLQENPNEGINAKFW